MKALLLLAVFAVGGVLGPAMHYAEHAAGAADGSSGGAPHEHVLKLDVGESAAGAVGSSTWAGEADQSAADGSALCWLCHLAKTGADPVAVSAPDREAARVATLVPAQSRAADRWGSYIFVRGPPLRS